MAEMEQDEQLQAAQAETVTQEKGLLDSIIDEGRMARTEAQKEYARDLIGEFAKQIMQGEMVVSKDTELMINARIAQIDRLLSRQLNEIMHNQELQKLEASWRGLFYLVNQSETGESLRIKVMNVSKKDLLKDMEKASEFDQSTLFKPSERRVDLGRFDIPVLLAAHHGFECRAQLVPMTRALCEQP